MFIVSIGLLLCSIGLLMYDVKTYLGFSLILITISIVLLLSVYFSDDPVGVRRDVTIRFTPDWKDKHRNHPIYGEYVKRDFVLGQFINGRLLLKDQNDIILFDTRTTTFPENWDNYKLSTISLGVTCSVLLLDDGSTLVGDLDQSRVDYIVMMT